MRLLSFCTHFPLTPPNIILIHLRLIWSYFYDKRLQMVAWTFTGFLTTNNAVHA